MTDVKCLAYQEDVVLSLNYLKQLNDAAMAQAPQDADLPLYPPLIYCLLHQYTQSAEKEGRVTWLCFIKRIQYLDID